MWLVLLLSCAEPPREPGRNAAAASPPAEAPLEVPLRGVTVRVIAGSPSPGERVDVLVQDPEWRPLAQAAEVVAVELPRVTLRLEDDAAAELAEVVAHGWSVSVRPAASVPHAGPDYASIGPSVP